MLANGGAGMLLIPLMYKFPLWGGLQCPHHRNEGRAGNLEEISVGCVRYEVVISCLRRDLDADHYKLWRAGWISMTPELTKAYASVSGYADKATAPTRALQPAKQNTGRGRSPARSTTGTPVHGSTASMIVPRTTSTTGRTGPGHSAMTTA